MLIFYISFHKIFNNQKVIRTKNQLKGEDYLAQIEKIIHGPHACTVEYFSEVENYIKLMQKYIITEIK